MSRTYRRTQRFVNKRALDVGMAIDVSRRAVWNEYAQRDVNQDENYRHAPNVPTLFITRLVRKYGNNIHGARILQSTTTWDGDGNRVIWYHHFEESIRLCA
jgi:hypothetical protein